MGKDNAAQASRFAKKYLAIAEKEYAFEIVVAKGAWVTYTEEQRNAITYHELLHCGMNEKGAWYIVRHDLEEFTSVVRFFGLWNDRTKIMAEQMKLWDATAQVRLVK